MQTSFPSVITPNRSQSNPDDMITLPRPIQSVGMDLHDVSGTSTGQTLPRERRAPPGTHFCPTIWWVYPHSATIFILHPLLSTFSSTFVRNIPTFDHSSTLKRRPQTSVTAADLVWVCAPPRTIRKWLRRLASGSCGPDLIRACGITGDWETMAVKAEVWVEAVTKGGRRFMAAWRQEEEDAGRHRQEKREATRLGKLQSHTET